jgi:hypothetical protein
MGSLRGKIRRKQIDYSFLGSCTTDVKKIFSIYQYVKGKKKAIM